MRLKYGTVMLGVLLALAARAGNVDSVNCLIGTAGSGAGYGGTMPWVEPPFAMTSWTPQTRQDNWSKLGATSYNYADTTMTGFMGTHQAAIWMRDYGSVTVMPEVDSIKTSPVNRQLAFRHSGEVATPYYYSAIMEAGAARKIVGEVTATEHCAIMRMTYPENTNASILVEAARTPGTRSTAVGSVTIDAAAQEISGYDSAREDAILSTIKLPNFRGYFVIRISKPFAAFGTYVGTNLQDGSTSTIDTNTSVGGYATFSTTNQEVVQIKVGTSFISVEQARANLAAEIPAWDFAGTEAHLKKTWNDKLSEVDIQGGASDDVTQFYTGMYHAMLFPRVFSEQGRYYSPFDDQIHNGVAYTDYSGWDIYRAEWGFLTMFCPERINGMVQALLNDYREGGWMPKWPNPAYTDIMYSTPAHSMIAEAINEGFNGFDYSLAFQAVCKEALTPPDGDATNRWPDRARGRPYDAREGLTYYLKYGYVPENWTARAGSLTLAHAYYDWCAGQIAKAIGNTNAWAYFNNRSFNYANIYNPANGLMNSRYADGTWAPTNHGWSEGGQTLYEFDVMQDIPGLIELMGGTTNFNNRLDTSTTDPNSLVNNEPGNHYPYLYDFSGEPWMCQRVCRSELAEFGNTPDGLPGNDDCGQTSACLLFADLGFYPFPPASGIFMIGSPVFPRMKLKLPNGHVFKITTKNNSANNLYIRSAELNGRALNAPCITYAQIEAGGTLHFVMGPKPSSWASSWRGTPLQRLSGGPFDTNSVSGN
jgi:predicted alpha-1,2-mannosidase